MARRTSADILTEVRRLAEMLGPDFEVTLQQGNGNTGVQSTLRITKAGDAGSGSTYHMGGARQSTWMWMATFNEGVSYALRKA